ncbi:MAG: hypothetical protein WBO36_15160, partial [Saprospiraceae bacterium]
MNKIMSLGTVALIICLTHWMINENDYIEPNPSIEKLAPSEEYFLLKQYPETIFHIKAYENALRHSFTFSKFNTNRSTGTWISQGPDNIG